MIDDLPPFYRDFMRYQWLKNFCCCPFAETDDAWDSPENLDKAIDQRMEEDADRPKPHEWDDDGCCVKCGFDGAEWHWWRYNTYEGKAKKTPCPDCERH